MTRRRDRGAGSIYKDATRGGYRGKVTLDGKEYVRRGKTRAEVVDRLNALMRDHARGVLAVNQTTTVAQLVEEYVDRVVPNRKGGNLSPTHRYTYRWAAGIIATEVGKTRAAKLTTRDVERMLDRLAARPMARSSITKVLGVLRLTLDHAVRRGDLARNVATVAELPGDMIAERRRQSLTPNMAERLLDGLNDERNGAMFAMSLLLGLRPGEAAGLYWQDIDGHVVNITRGRQTDERGRVEVVDNLKTTSAKRTLEMPDQLVDMLARHRTRQATERLAAATWVDPQLVFATKVGTPLSTSAVRKQLADICTRLDVMVDDPAGPRPPLPYELRHTAASLYSAAGVAHEAIADLYGLTSPRMIETRYRHRLRPTVAVAREVNWRAGTDG
jgi:integrase